MLTTLWGLLAGLFAVGAELAYRHVPEDRYWVEYLWAWIPLQLGIGYCVFRLVTSPGVSLVEAFVVFAFSTALLRLVLSLYVLHDPISKGAWAAFALLLLARLVQTAWR